MWGLKKRNKDGGTAVAEPPAAEPVPATLEELRAEIARLESVGRDRRDRAAERRLLTLRHHAGIALTTAGEGSGALAEADPAGLPLVAGSLPELHRDELTAARLRAGILRDGCLLVRGLVDRDEALRFAGQIDRSFAERERALAGEQAAEGYYEEFLPEDPYQIIVRPWIREGGGVLAVDAPMLTAEMLDMFRAAGVPQVVGEYLGEPPVISAHKTTLRKAEPTVGGAWHQDGKFMGDVKALNLWLSLSRCGDVAPGLDIVPTRVDEIVLDRGEDAALDYIITQEKAEEIAAGVGAPIIRPIFEPGDALFFDDKFLHQTGSDAAMSKPRYAIESWFFGPSAFPGDYAPVAV